MLTKTGDTVHECMRIVTSLFDMLSLLSPLMVLLSMFGINNGQEEFGRCNYHKDIDVGKQSFLYNPNYPENYKPGSSCRWVATSARPIKVSCNTFTLPVSPECQDFLTIQDGTTKSDRYCGNGTIELISRSNQLTFTLSTSGSSTGGKFLCSLKTVESPDDSYCRCGWKKRTHIVGGSETGVNEYPMMSGLVDIPLKSIFCGASIINEIQVLTAAHCVIGKSMSKLGVVVGEHDVTTDSETNVTKLFRVGNFTIHPLYDSSGYDIAIVTIIGKIRYSPEVGPVCLPFQHSADTFGGYTAEGLDWGFDEVGGTKATTLQKTQLSVLTNADCSQTYPNVSSKQLCTYTLGKDRCEMDSGGPILWQHSTDHRLVQIGLISSGISCGSSEPAISTRVGAFIEWILWHTPPGISYCKLE